MKFILIETDYTNISINHRRKKFIIILINSEIHRLNYVTTAKKTN